MGYKPMIQALLSIIDRLIQIKKYRTQRLRTIYLELLDPLFNDLLLIHGDYIKMFQDVHDMLPRSSDLGHSVPTSAEVRRINFEQAVETLQRRRTEFQPIRIRIRALGNELAKQKPRFNQEVQEFINTVLNYFPQGDILASPSGWPSGSSLLLELMEKSTPIDNDISSDAYNYTSLRRTIRNMIREHGAAWGQLCVAFAKVKILVTTSG